MEEGPDTELSDRPVEGCVDDTNNPPGDLFDAVDVGL